MQGIYRRPAPVLSAKAATGVGNTIPVHELETIAFQLSAAVDSSLTVKFQGSFSDTAPDFSATQSGTNHWDYIDVTDMQSGSSVDGDTGITLNNDSVVNNTRQYYATAPFLRWVNCEVTAYTDGDVTVTCGGRE